MKKYNVKPPRDLRSKFELKQEAKRDAEKQAEKEKLRKEEEERIAVCFIYQSCVLQIIPLVHIFKSNIFIGSQLKWVFLTNICVSSIYLCFCMPVYMFETFHNINISRTHIFSISNMLNEDQCFHQWDIF